MGDPKNAARHFFEGELRTVKEIHDMIPAIGLSTLRQWVREGRLPATKQEALTRPKQYRYSPTREHKAKLRGLALAPKQKREK